MEISTKEQWVTPDVKTFGTIEEITQQNKKLGPTDGFYYISIANPIGS